MSTWRRTSLVLAVGALPVLAAALVPALTSAPAAVATPVAARGPIAAAQVPYSALRPGATGSAVFSAAPPAARLTPAAGTTAGTTAGYVDTCNDPRLPDGSAGAPAALDLRGLSFADDGTGALTLTVTSCTAWTDTDVDGQARGIDIPLAVPNGRGDGADFAIILERGQNGALALSTYRTPTDDPADSERTSGPIPVARPDAFTATAAFPKAALDSAAQFLFLASSLDTAGRVDNLPEVYADPLAYPMSCTVTVEQTATVVVDPAQSGAVTEQVRASGLAVRSSHPALLSVQGVSDLALEVLRRTPGVRSAHRAVAFQRLVAAPDDPEFGRQWSLRERPGGVRALQGWDVRTGSGSLLAVVDDGVDGVRAELAGRVVEGRDTVPYSSLEPGEVVALPANGDSDLGGHGTAVAGVAAANSDNGTGVTGVDWTASVLPYRVFDAAGCASDFSVVTALYDASDRGAAVINLSLGGPSDSTALRQAVTDVTARGALVVAAAGNSGESAPGEISYPAAYPEVLAVGASTREGALAGYSSTGGHLDVAAPGGAASGSPDDDLRVLGARGSVDAQAGTSFAAPLVAGAALLFRAEHPELSPAQVAAAVRRTARDAGPPGSDPGFGAGILDLDALLHLPVPRPRSTELACPLGEVPRGLFGDAPETALHALNIDCVAWWKVASGRDGRYLPDDLVSREQMAAFLARLIQQSGGELPAEPADAFSDDEGSVHELRINQLAALGVVGGVGGGRFAPAGFVTRGQMATFLTKAYEARTRTTLPAAGDYFPDDGGTTHESRTNQAAAIGFTGGLVNGDYGHGLQIKRNAMATFLARVLDRLVADGLTATPRR